MIKEDFKNSLEVDLVENLHKLELEKTNCDVILSKLLESIKPVDFQALSHSDVVKLRERLEGQNSSSDEYQRLSKEIQSYKVSKSHYLILCIEKLLQTAKQYSWGLCKKNDFIYLYNGSYWINIDKEKFQYFLGNAALKMGVEKFKGKIHTFKEDLFKQFMSDAYLPTPKVNNKRVLINFQNGTLEIISNRVKLRDFDPNDFLTYQLDFDYNPNAKCPRFQNFLDEVLEDQDKQKVLAEYCGYIFVKNSFLKLEKMLILYGTGANGKSVFFEILSAVIGSENTTSFSLEKLTGSENGSYRAKIANKLLNYASEINGKLETSVLKQMVSGEPIEARPLYSQPFSIEDYAKLIFNCNELPRDVEHTNAFFRRFLIIHFDKTIPEDKQDKQLAQKIIENELPGVFNWILEGLDRVIKQKGFSKCEAIDKARNIYENQSDSVKVFLDEYNYQISIDQYIAISSLYPEYQNFCREDGFMPVNKSNFMNRLRHHKVLVKRLGIGNVAYLKLN